MPPWNLYEKARKINYYPIILINDGKTIYDFGKRVPKHYPHPDRLQILEDMSLFHTVLLSEICVYLWKAGESVIVIQS